MPWRDRLVESDDKSSEDFGEVLREWIGDLGRAPESYSEAAAIPL
jgi:predicted transcriptional regulator